MFAFLAAMGTHIIASFHDSVEIVCLRPVADGKVRWKSVQSLPISGITQISSSRRFVIMLDKTSLQLYSALSVDHVVCFLELELAFADML